MDSNEIDRQFLTTSLASALKTGVTLARLGKTTQKIFHRWLFNLLPLSSSKLPLFHFSLLCSLSTKSISRSAGGREASNK